MYFNLTTLLALSVLLIAFGSTDALREKRGAKIDDAVVENHMVDKGNEDNYFDDESLPSRELRMLGRSNLEDDHEEMAEGMEAKRWFWQCRSFYNPLKKRCCHGTLYTRKTHACCDNQVVEKQRCGEKLYSPCNEGCCEGGDGSRVYSKTFKKCCKGNVQFKWFTKHCGPLLHG